MMVIIMHFFKSLARGRVVSTRRASTQAELSPGQRGMEAAKFGHEKPFDNFVSFGIFVIKL